MNQSERELKTIHGLAHKMRRLYRLPAEMEEDLVSAAVIALLRVEGKSDGYRMVVAKNAALKELSAYLERGERSIVDAASNRPRNFHEFAFDPEPRSDGTSWDFNFLDEERMLRALNNLPQRLRIVVEMRFGLGGASVHRWEVLASRLGCSLYAVQGAFDEALALLREEMKCQTV